MWILYSAKSSKIKTGENIHLNLKGQQWTAFLITNNTHEKINNILSKFCNYVIKFIFDTRRFNLTLSCFSLRLKCATATVKEVKEKYFFCEAFPT